MEHHAVTDVDENSFGYRVLDADGPVLVEFWAPWCDSCARLAPVLEEVAREVGGAATVVRVNADENGELLFRLNVRGIPTMKVYRCGEVVKTIAGARTKEDILGLLLP